MKRLSGFIAIALLAFVFALPVFAEYNLMGIPDSAEIRRNISRSWFEAPLDEVRLLNTEVRKSSDGLYFQVRLEEQLDSFLTIVAPKASITVDIYEARGKRTVTEDTYPADTIGAWVLARDKKSGEMLFARYYFAKDCDVYVQFRPNGKASYADMFIGDAYAARSVPIGVPFERFYTASFQEIRNITARTLPWNYVDVIPGLYADINMMIQVIRAALPDIVMTDDAMYDEDGCPVLISNGNKRRIQPKDAFKLTVSSAGFVKWICDGLVEPVAGSYLRRVPLTKKTYEVKETGLQGIVGQKYDLSFSLDWTRNLAAAVLSVNRHKTYLYPEAGVDVTENPFAAIMTDKGLHNSFGYITNTGYRPEVLRSLLYVLAATEKSYFYLAAIRETDEKSPEVKAFNEAAAIFPYFDAEGAFHVVVFWNGKEYSLKDFVRTLENRSARTNEVFVHLTRVHSASKFYPLEPLKPQSEKKARLENSEQAQ